MTKTPFAETKQLREYRMSNRKEDMQIICMLKRVVDDRDVQIEVAGINTLQRTGGCSK